MSQTLSRLCLALRNATKVKPLSFAEATLNFFIVVLFELSQRLVKLGRVECFLQDFCFVFFAFSHELHKMEHKIGKSVDHVLTQDMGREKMEWLKEHKPHIKPESKWWKVKQ